MQDILRLGDESRMNTPATSTGNWAWRMTPEQLDPLLANGVRDMTQAYGRTADAGHERGANPWDYTDPQSGIDATQSW
ncbi:MAG TPA: 4-alpha-glucanotransferase, partial [Thermomicrobiales bacterium]|nr:4-alpha-glucanotransferase [Thermomicrobiales bacterium]